MDKTNFSNITPCGGNCEQCGFFHDGGCKGCRENGAYFCGICYEFPCEFLKNKLAEWDKNGVYRLKQLAEEYREQKKT